MDSAASVVGLFYIHSFNFLRNIPKAIHCAASARIAVESGGELPHILPQYIQESVSIL